MRVWGSKRERRVVEYGGLPVFFVILIDSGLLPILSMKHFGSVIKFLAVGFIILTHSLRRIPNSEKWRS